MGSPTKAERCHICWQRKATVHFSSGPLAGVQMCRPCYADHMARMRADRRQRLAEERRLEQAPEWVRRAARNELPYRITGGRSF